MLFRSVVQECSSGAFFRSVLQERSSGAFFGILQSFRPPMERFSGAFFRSVFQEHSSGAFFRSVLQERSSGAFFRILQSFRPPMMCPHAEDIAAFFSCRFLPVTLGIQSSVLHKPRLDSFDSTTACLRPQKWLLLTSFKDIYNDTCLLCPWMCVLSLFFLSRECDLLHASACMSGVARVVSNSSNSCQHLLIARGREIRAITCTR